MERREEVRKNFEKDVVISCKGLGIVSGVSKDISRTGIYVETPAVQLENHRDVNLCFVLDIDAVSRVETMNAEVVRVDAGGIGLRFKKAINEDSFVM